MRIAPRHPRRRALARLIQLALALVLGVLLLPRPAFAAGTVTLGSREPTESDGRWKLNMTIDFGGTPHLPHIPMLFSFTPTVLYERTLTDKSPDKPVLTRMPLVNQQAIIESMDVGFSDASGKIFKVTKFDFVIRRDHGFEAGEYDFQIKRADDGVQMGQTIKLVLKGDNVVVDRRAIMFTGEKKKKDAPKADDAKKDEPAKGDEAKKDEPAKADDATAGDAPKDGVDPNGPPPVPPKQGGCGCRLAGDVGSDEGALALLILGVAVATRRRRLRSLAP